MPTCGMVEAEHGVRPVQVGGGHEFELVPQAQVNAVPALDRLLGEGLVAEALKVHERHLGGGHRGIRVQLQDIPDQPCSGRCLIGGRRCDWDPAGCACLAANEASVQG